MMNKPHVLLSILTALLATALGSIEMFNKNEGVTVEEQEVIRAKEPPAEISFKCLGANGTYMPSDKKTCVCIAFLLAKCTVNNPPATPTTTTTAPFTAPHPLDPLTAEEIKSTSQIIEAYNNTRAQQNRYIYNWITLEEPPKFLMLPFFLTDTYPSPNTIPRKSFSVLIERATGNVYEVIVNLSDGQVESFVQVMNVQPSLSPEDQLRAEEITRANATVQARAAALGYPNMSLVFADPWSVGYVEDMPQFKGRRLMQQYLYGRNSIDDNQYAHPMDFLPIVDLNKGVVIAIQDLPTHDDFDASNKNGNTVPKKESNYDYKLRGGKAFLRRDDKPITVESPEGPSYTLTGNELQWQKWKMRIGFNGREGLVIYMVNYNDNGKVRPVMYRASLTEQFIPYADPRPPYYRKAVFDLGEYGIGFNADRQRLGEDVIGAAKLLSCILNNSTGDPITYKDILSIREEDAGILWKHVDYRTGKGVVVRSHRLVLSFIATVGNYEYLFLWKFYQDGSIEFQVQLSGILSTNLLATNANATKYGSIEATQTNAQYHQHFFAVRLDTEIDGNNNSVYTSDAVSLPEPTGSVQNPYGQGFTTNKTDLTTASNARTNIAPLEGRVWIVTNPNSLNPYTQQPVGWKLMPSSAPPLLLKQDSPLRPKAAFLDYDVWVVPYAEHQLYPGGFYLNNSGLPEWVGNNPDASVSNTDIVLFHMFGLTHIPRVEDYPVMPVEQTGFWFKPYNFFSENPAIDVPPANVIKRKQEL